MNNIQKSFKRKSELRGMADGGSVRREIDPAVLGTGGAARAGQQIRDHNRRTAAEIDSLFEPAATPAPQPAPAKKPEEKSALRSFFGLADGGQVFKNTVGGVPTYTDARAATAGATAHTPGSGGGTFSVVGMEPAQKQQMADAAAQRQAAANAPTTLGGRLDAALGKLNSPAATTGAPSSTPTLGSELDAAIGRTQGVTSAQTPATGAPANATSGFTPQERQTFNSMSQTSAAGAAQMRDIGLRAGEAAAAAARPASPLQFDTSDTPSFELEFADGGDVEGKGGPTDDKVGPVMLSDGEYVLPADTVDIVGRDKLDALRLATHDFVDEDNKPKVSRLRKMADGGPVYADPEDLANRRLLSGGLGQPPQPAAGSSGGGGRGLVPYQPTATGSPGGGGRGLVPSRPPTGLAPYEPPVTKLSFTETPRPQAASGAPAKAASKLGTAIRAVGGAIVPATAAYAAYTDSPEARSRAASGQEGVAGVAAQVGSYLGSALTAGTSSPQDIGAMTSALRGEGTYAYHAVPDAEKGWARSIGERYFPTESARIMSDRARLTPDTQARVDVLRRNGIDVNNMSEDDFTRARELLAVPSLQGATPVVDVLGRSAMADESNRRSGGGIDGSYAGAMENRSGLTNSDPRINGSTSALYNARGDNDVVGSFNGRTMTKREADARAAGLQTASSQPPEREPTQMDQMRSLLREFGGGGAYGGGSTASARKAMADINKRYDDMLRNGAGRNRVRGLDWSQRHGLDLERARASELGEFARNQSALRGQDMQAVASANSNRTAALQVAAGMMERQQNAADRLQAAQLRAQADAARAQADAAKAQTEAEAAERSASEAGVKDLSDYIETAFPDDPRGAARFRTFVQSAGPDQVGELTTLHGGDRRRAFEDMRQRMLIQDRGGGGNIFTGKRSSGYDPVANVNLDPGWRDILSAWWDGGMGVRDTGLSMLKEFSVGDNSLVTHDSGQVRPASKLRGDDMRSTKTIEDMVADRPRREALRRAATDN